jgi:hypothetical protein
MASSPRKTLEEAERRPTGSGCVLWSIKETRDFYENTPRKRRNYENAPVKFEIIEVFQHLFPLIKQKKNLKRYVIDLVKGSL